MSNMFVVLNVVVFDAMFPFFVMFVERLWMPRTEVFM